MTASRPGAHPESPGRARSEPGIREEPRADTPNRRQYHGSSNSSSPHRPQEGAVLPHRRRRLARARATASSSRSSASTTPRQGDRPFKLDERSRQLLARRRRAADATPFARSCARPACSRRATRARLGAQAQRRRRARSASADEDTDGRRDASDVTAPDLTIVGRVRKAHGIRGELVVEPLTDAPDAVFAPGRRVFAGTVDGDPPRRTARELASSTKAGPFKERLHRRVRGHSRSQRGRAVARAVPARARRASSRRSATTRSTCTTCSGCACELDDRTSRSGRSPTSTSCRRA